MLGHRGGILVAVHDLRGRGGGREPVCWLCKSGRGGKRRASGRRADGQVSRAGAGRQHAGQSQAPRAAAAVHTGCYARRQADLTCICSSVMPSQRCSASAHDSAAHHSNSHWKGRQAAGQQAGFSSRRWQPVAVMAALASNLLRCRGAPWAPGLPASLTSQRGGRNDEHGPLVPVSRHHSNCLHRLQQASDGEANKQAQRDIESQLQLRAGPGCQSPRPSAAVRSFKAGAGAANASRCCLLYCCTATAAMQVLQAVPVPCPGPSHLRSAPARRGAAQTARPRAGRASAAAQGWRGCGSSGCCRPGCARWPAGKKIGYDGGRAGRAGRAARCFVGAGNIDRSMREHASEATTQQAWP